MALGSTFEVECQLQLALDLGFLALAEHAPLQARISDVKRMLTGLRTRLRSDPMLLRDNPDLED